MDELAWACARYLAEQVRAGEVSQPERIYVGAGTMGRQIGFQCAMHGFDTVKGSDFLGDQDVIEYFAEEAPKELALLENWGCPWSRNEDGTVATRAFEILDEPAPTAEPLQATPGAGATPARTAPPAIRFDGISFTYFTSKDVVRHPLVKKIVAAYEQEENN